MSRWDYRVGWGSIDGDLNKAVLQQLRWLDSGHGLCRSGVAAKRSKRRREGE